jgi:hypothetical protein
MVLSNELVSEFSPLVSKIGNEFSRRYRMVDRHDICQELWIWFMTHPNKTKEWLSVDSQKEATKLFAKSLRNAALGYCIREKARIEGYAPEDNFFYSKEFIKDLLPAVLSDDPKRIQKVLDTGAKTAKDLSESGDWMAFSADVRKAYSKLQPEEKRLVYLFYAEDVSGSDLHVQVKSDRPSARADMMAANRALNKLVKNLGGFKPYYEDDEVKGEQDDLSELQDSGGSESEE